MPSLPTLMNLAPTLVLHTPALHRLLSSRYLLLEFTGHKTGRRYRTPVAYVRSSETLLISTDSTWWRSLAAHPPVRVRLRNRWQEADGQQITDPDSAADALGRLVRAVPGYWRAAGLRADRGVTPEGELFRAVTEERKVFEIRANR